MRQINWKTHLIVSAISLVVGGGIFVLFYFLHGQGNLGVIDGSAYAAVILLSIGGLCFVGNEGFFDIFAYGFKQGINSIFGRVPNAQNDFAGYKEQKRITREHGTKYYVSILIVGALFLIFYIIYSLVVK